MYIHRLLVLAGALAIAAPSAALAGSCEPSWSALGSGIEGEHGYGVVYGIATFDDGTGKGPALFVGGDIAVAGGLPVAHIARWDGAWSSIPGTDEDIFALAVHDDGAGPALFAGGSFNEAGGVPAAGIAKWDGTAWSALGEGLVPWATVTSLAVFDDGSGNGPALYAAGGFDTAGGVAAGNIARWDGSRWAPLGEGLQGQPGYVWDMAVLDDGSGPALYVAGRFTNAGSVRADNVARWDGTSWTAVGTGILIEGHPQAVRALEAYDDGNGPALYAAGTFTSAGGVPVHNIARWDGGRWTSVGGGVLIPGSEYTAVWDLLSVEDGLDDRPGLYAAGAFTLAGGAKASIVARWNGAFWSPFAEGLQGTAAVLAPVDSASDGHGLYVGGYFFTDVTPDFSGIARLHTCPIDDPPPYNECRYNVTMIQGPPSDHPANRSYVRATDINEAGRIVGYGHFEGGAFSWTAEEGFVTLVVPAGGDERAFGVNGSGQVVGSFEPFSHYFGHLAYLSDAGRAIELAMPPGGNNSHATAINDRGQIVGCWANSVGGPGLQAILWNDGGIVDIGPDLGPTSSEALDINDLGQVTGWVGPLYSQTSAYVWAAGMVTDLGPVPGGVNSRGSAINDQGQVLVSGWMQQPLPGEAPAVRSYLWQDGTWTELCEGCYGWSLNDLGQVVGTGSAAGAATHGGDEGFVFFWADGVMTRVDIPWDLGIKLSEPAAINNTGWIAATGYFMSETVALFLTPTAERAADIDGNCRVGMTDLLILLYEWDDAGSVADLDGDGSVGIRDLLLLLEDWG